MRVSVGLVVTVVLLATFQSTQADAQGSGVLSANLDQDVELNLEIKKNATRDVERYVRNNSPDNYPLEDPEDTSDNTSTTTNVEHAELTQKEISGISPTGAQEVVTVDSLDNDTSVLNSPSEESVHNINVTAPVSNQTISIEDLDSHKENLTFTNYEITTKHFPIPDSNTAQPNTLEIIEVTHYIPENENDENETYKDREKIPDLESFSTIASSMSDEIKVYSNQAMMGWEDVKEKLEKASEASQVLEDYLDKIRISQSANNTDCVKTDLENYDRRKGELREIVLNCEETIKREAWNKLQKKTRNILGQIYDIKEKVVQDDARLINANENTIEKRTSIETEGKHLLRNLNLVKFKKELSAIEKRCLREDEDNLMTCIKNRTEKGIIVDTLNDIMRIKNNCVG